jgi:hypothetical protein
MKQSPTGTDAVTTRAAVEKSVSIVRPYLPITPSLSLFVWLTAVSASSHSQLALNFQLDAIRYRLRA